MLGGGARGATRAKAGARPPTPSRVPDHETIHGAGRQLNSESGPSLTFPWLARVAPSISVATDAFDSG